MESTDFVLPYGVFRDLSRPRLAAKWHRSEVEFADPIHSWTRRETPPTLSEPATSHGPPGSYALGRGTPVPQAAPHRTPFRSRLSHSRQYRSLLESTRSTECDELMTQFQSGQCGRPRRWPASC